jgi:hypothetical protein
MKRERLVGIRFPSSSNPDGKIIRKFVVLGWCD